MSGKTARQIRKSLNAIARNQKQSKMEVAEELTRELLNSPFKYRLLFAMKLIFRRRRK